MNEAKEHKFFPRLESDEEADLFVDVADLFEYDFFNFKPMPSKFASQVDGENALEGVAQPLLTALPTAHEESDGSPGCWAIADRTCRRAHDQVADF